jgi:hypothetical protein
MPDKRPEETQSCPTAIRETIRLMSEIDRAITNWPIE